MILAFDVPLKTKSVNQSFRGNWQARAGTAKSQRAKVSRLMPAWALGPLLEVRLTRVSKGTLDSDSVPTALKHVRDAVAAKIGIDDGSPLVTWSYFQAKGEPLVHVEVWRLASVGKQDFPTEPVTATPVFGREMAERMAERHAPVLAPAPRDETPMERLRRLATPASKPARKGRGR